MAMYGQGKTRGQVAKLEIEAATNQACAAIRPNDDVCNKDFLYQHLLLSYKEIRALGHGCNQKNLNLSIVKSIIIPVPSLALQQQFATQVEAIEHQKELLRAQQKDAEQLMAERMQYYFS